MAAIRRATVKWNGDLASGDGHVSADTSRRLLRAAGDVGLAHRARRRPDQPGGAAGRGPRDLLLDGVLERSGEGRFAAADRLEVTAEVTFDRVDGKWTVVSSKLTVRGRVPGLSNDRFRAIAEQAKDGCPISRALAGNVAISVDARSVVGGRGIGARTSGRRRRNAVAPAATLAP